MVSLLVGLVVSMAASQVPQALRPATVTVLDAVGIVSSNPTAVATAIEQQIEVAVTDNGWAWVGTAPQRDASGCASNIECLRQLAARRRAEYVVVVGGGYTERAATPDFSGYLRLFHIDEFVSPQNEIECLACGKGPLAQQILDRTSSMLAKEMERLAALNKVPVATPKETAPAPTQINSVAVLPSVAVPDKQGSRALPTTLAVAGVALAGTGIYYLIKDGQREGSCETVVPTCGYANSKALGWGSIVGGAVLGGLAAVLWPRDHAGGSERMSVIIGPQGGALVGSF